MIEKRILVIDDEQSLREMLQTYLVSLGYVVKSVEKPAEALEILQKKRFQLIITDLSMPEINGVELCKKIRKNNSLSVIYALSGYISQYKAEKLDQVGFNGYLCKPVKLEILRRAIEGAFDQVDKNDFPD